jgi:hypothetical protein
MSLKEKLLKSVDPVRTAYYSGMGGFFVPLITSGDPKISIGAAAFAGAAGYVAGRKIEHEALKDNHSAVSAHPTRAIQPCLVPDAY